MNSIAVICWYMILYQPLILMNCTLITWGRVLGKHWIFAQLLGRRRGIINYIIGLCGLVMTTTQDGEQKCRGAMQVRFRRPGNPRWILGSQNLLGYYCTVVNFELCNQEDFSVAISFRTYWELYLSYYGSLGSFA